MKGEVAFGCRGNPVIWMYKNGTPMNKSDPIMNITEFVAKYNPQARKIVIKSKKYHYPTIYLKNPMHVLVEIS